MKFVPRAPIDNRRGEQYTRSKTQNAPPAARRALIKGGIRHDPKTVRFAAALGWGPGVSGCSLKSVLAAASLLQWAEQTNLTSRTTDAIEDAFSQWYDALDSMDQESFAEAWPLIKDDANALLTDKDSLSGRIEDAGLDPADLPGCSEKNWDALQDVIDRLTPEAKGEF